jgi:hypothetical protein
MPLGAFRGQTRGVLKSLLQVNQIKRQDWANLFWKRE